MHLAVGFLDRAFDLGPGLGGQLRGPLLRGLVADPEAVLELRDLERPVVVPEVLLQHPLPVDQQLLADRVRHQPRELASDPDVGAEPESPVVGVCK